MSRAIAFVGTVNGSIFAEGLSFGPLVSGRVVARPDGEINSVASVGMQVGAGIGFPFVEGGVRVPIFEDRI